MLGLEVLNAELQDDGAGVTVEFEDEYNGDWIW